MGSPLSPVIANFYMEDFEKKAIEKAPHMPACLYRYMDDTFVIWLHGQVKLMVFLNLINGIHNNIQFTMEIEEEEVHLPFLSRDIYRKIVAPLDIKSTGKQLTPIYNYTKVPITTQLTNNLSSPP
jgi:hypothetical protein